MSFQRWPSNTARTIYDHMECNEEGGKPQTPQHRRRKLNQDEALALYRPVESTSKERESEGKDELGGGEKIRL